MKAVVAAFNQEKALVGAFSVITNLRMELFQALLSTIGTGGSEDSEANESSLGDGCRLVAPVAGSHQNISSQHRNMMLR